MTTIFGRFVEIIFFIFAMIASVFEMKSSGIEYKIVPTDERIAFVQEYIDEYNTLAEYAFEKTGGSGSISANRIDSSTKRKIKHIEKKMKERISVYCEDDCEYVTIKFPMGAPGFPDAGLYYFRKGDYVDARSWAEYDHEREIFVEYNNANYREIIPIGDGWFIYQTAYYDSPGFRRKEE